MKKKKIEKIEKDDIIIENMTNPSNNNQQLIQENITPDSKNQFNELLEIISKLTELQFYTVYSDSAEKIEKEYPMIKYEYFYRTEYLNKLEDEDQEFGPFDWESITNWVDTVIIIIDY